MRTADSNSTEYTAKISVKDVEKRKEIAATSYATAIENLGKLKFPTSIFEGTAIAILLDLSGSMANRLPVLSGEVAAITDHLEALGARVSVLGFTTHGWRGGEARRDWVSAGQPAYPGRLCALKHICFKDFDQSREPDDWDSMLDGKILRENVDGEAIQWANGLLGRRGEAHRVLLVVSDGAPVDDSTIMANGKNYLYRHLKQVISELQADDQCHLVAVGIEHQVNSIYSKSMAMEDLFGFAETVSSYLAELLRPAMVGVAKKPE
ncbi:MAG: hypothetical protein C0510_00905 [Erythrobacter sp.]|nr:hypothetical protein [Erythrobacter sp.]